VCGFYVLSSVFDSVCMRECVVVRIHVC